LYVDNELKNLQTIATHERFVEGVATIHLEEFIKVDMDVFRTAVVLPWGTCHNHCSPILYFIQVPCMQVTHICWEIFQLLFADQRPSHDKFRLRGYHSLGKPLVLEARMSSTLIPHSAAHFSAISKFCPCTREEIFSDNILRGGIDLAYCPS
jgi:hypothetical protein